jgi:uncharacterized protein
LPLYALYCVDKPNALELRMANREAHLTYAGTFRAQLKLGGPLLDEDGNMAGSMLVLDVADLAEAEAFAADDPYAKAGLFERVTIKRFRPTLGGFAD